MIVPSKIYRNLIDDPQKAFMLNDLYAECESERIELKRSPCFAMSRGGKELFHTNFLSFAVEIETETIEDEAEKLVVTGFKKALIDVLFSCGGASTKAPLAVQTWREKNQLDLVVLAAPKWVDEKSSPGFDGGTLSMREAKTHSRLAWQTDLGLIGVVVEAKFKALPTKDQLKRYDLRLQKEITLELEEPLSSQEERPWGSVGLNLTDPSLAPTSKNAFIVARRAAGDLSRTLEPEDKDQRNRPIFAAAAGRVRRVLLSPGAAPDWLPDTQWEHLSWDHLLNVMRDALSKSGSSNGLAGLLRDYVNFTGQLLKILEKTSDAVRGFCELNSDETCGSLALAHRPFGSLRIQDVVGKFCYDKLRIALLRQSRCEQSVADFQLKTSTFFSNGMPGLDVEYCYPGTPREITVGIQLQGAMYRHYIKSSSPSSELPLLQVARCLGDPLAQTQENRGWWLAGERIERDAISQAGFSRFGSEAFLYNQCNVSTLTATELSKKLNLSLGVLVGLLVDGEFADSAKAFANRP